MKKKMGLMGIILLLILGLYSLSIMLPLLWAVLTSFKSVDEFEFFNNILGFPTEFTFENYLLIFEKFAIKPSSIMGTTKTLYFENMLLNSLIYVFGASLCASFMPFLTAYLNVKFPGKIANIMFVIVMVTMSLPIVGAYPSEIQLLVKLNLYNKFLGVFLMRGSFLGVYYLIFYATFKSLGNDYYEAASIDGASEFRIMVKIMFPLARTSFFTVFLLLIITYWNDYQAPMLYMPLNATLSYGLYSLEHGSIDNSLSYVTVHMAGVVMVILPMLTLFAIFKKNIMNNINMGGVKE